MLGFLDDTHDKVYELNKQMCDLGKTLSNPLGILSEEAIQDIAKALEITRKPKGIIMEEKKTKKMTKAEAFEWLKCKKIDCRDASSSQVQAKLFELDLCWITGDKNICVTQFLLVDAYGCISHCGYDYEYFDKLLYTQVSADDILSIEIVDEKYELEFNYDKVVELAKPLMHYLNEVGCPDSIRVSQLGIVHEPMSTLIFDNGIGRI